MLRCCSTQSAPPVRQASREGRASSSAHQWGRHVSLGLLPVAEFGIHNVKFIVSHFACCFIGRCGLGREKTASNIVCAFHALCLRAYHGMPMCHRLTGQETFFFLLSLLQVNWEDRKNQGAAVCKRQNGKHSECFAAAWLSVKSRPDELKTKMV